MFCRMNWIKWRVYFTIFFIQISLSTSAIPELQSKTNDLTKAIDSNIFMSCKFKSVKKVTFSWFKDGQQISYSSKIYTSNIGKGMQVLNIEEVNSTHKGTYTCVATNSDGKASADIKVDIILNYKPKIHPISDVYLKEGSSYQVECNSEAIPATVTYQWKKKNGRIGGNVIAQNNILRIRKMQRADEGLYICTASNSEGPSTESFNLAIAEQTQWIEKPKDENISTTQPFEWVASIVTLSTNPVFKWYKDGSHILRNSSMTIQGAKFTSRLKFPDLNLGDAGIYKVTVEKLNFAGLESDMKLTVFAPPTILISEGSEVQLEIGDSLSISCNVEANPHSSIQWYFNGTVLLSIPANGTQVLTLKKDNLKEQDMGEYQCYASNEKGNATVSINVIVEPPAVSVALKVTIIVIACGVLVGLIILSIFFYLKYGERCIKVGMDEGTFYTDLVEEEKELSSLADLENNPNTLKKNINMSTRRNTTATSRGTNPEKGNILHTIRSLSMKKVPEKTLGRQVSIFDTIKTNPKNSRPGSVLQTLKTTIKRSPSQENHELRLGSFALCAGKSVAFNKLCFDEVIAEGEYGGVTKGRLLEDDDDANIEVSIKMLKDDMMKSREKRNMLSEIRLMRRIPSHENIVEFIGWCVSSSNIHIIEEYMPFGNLLSFLRAQRQLVGIDMCDDSSTNDVCVDQCILLSYARQIALGMMHLAKLQIVHRDLACRNIYISFENTVKISDHAIVRDIYTPNVYRQTTGGQLPVRWMAYEAIFNGEYSVKSDVWSFGILLWELCTFGRIPYPGIMRTEQLLEELSGGYHMETPGNISTDLYLLMDSCWNKNPGSRPTFSSLYAQLSDYINDINDTEENVVHIDLSNMYEKQSASDDFMTPTEDFRFHFAPVMEEKEEEEEYPEHNETDPLA